MENGKTSNARIMCIILLVIMLMYPPLSYKIALYDEQRNLSGMFTWDKTDCELKTDSNLMHKALIWYFPIDKLKGDTELYVYNSQEFHYDDTYQDFETIKDEQYVRVSTGKYVGYVKCKDLDNQVKSYSFYLKQGSVVYGFTENKDDNRLRPWRCNATDQVIFECDEEIKVEMIGKLQPEGYFLVMLPNGLEGMVEKENIIEIKD